MWSLIFAIMSATSGAMAVIRISQGDYIWGAYSVGLAIFTALQSVAEFLRSLEQEKANGLP